MISVPPLSILLGTYTNLHIHAYIHMDDVSDVHQQPSVTRLPLAAQPYARLCATCIEKFTTVAAWTRMGMAESDMGTLAHIH